MAGHANLILNLAHRPFRWFYFGANHILNLIGTFRGQISFYKEEINKFSLKNTPLYLILQFACEKKGFGDTVRITRETI